MNERTLLEENENRPERRTAFVARELHRLNLDIVALSETRIAGEGQLCEEGGGYTFFWKGQEPKTPRKHGVGFAVKNCMLFSLTEYPSGLNERLMTLRLNLEGNKHATVISAYAPTLLAEDQTKELFYAALDTALTAIPNEDKVILLGDFNARVGRDSDIWRGTIGKEGVGKINANGTLLLSKCVEHDLVVTNTLFRQKINLKPPGKHPRSKHWHLLDYIIVRSRDQKDVLLTRSVTGSEDCWTDHRLVYSCIRMKILTKKRNAHALKRLKFNVDSLKNDSNKLELQRCLANKLEQEYPPNSC
ncbi:craniofacial development protein 2-like [Macrobrachium nipponense]|uniref:craniofacial development protein 2-like n=1 Tax=Macrobrachium nipponense TaxID=159736 RepID=UPI0030C83C27